MKFVVSVLQRAWSDADRTFEWIARKSPQGAINWYRAFDAALVQLESDADKFSVAPESAQLGILIRQNLFKTRHGHTYRLIYSITGDEVRVLRVRGPGQAPVTTKDLAE
jgi:plasmid stabilization system protein ParE